MPLSTTYALVRGDMKDSSELVRFHQFWCDERVVGRHIPSLKRDTVKSHEANILAFLGWCQTHKGGKLSLENYGNDQHMSDFLDWLEHSRQTNIPWRGKMLNTATKVCVFLHTNGPQSTDWLEKSREYGSMQASLPRHHPEILDLEDLRARFKFLSLRELHLVRQGYEKRTKFLLKNDLRHGAADYGSAVMFEFSVWRDYAVVALYVLMPFLRSRDLRVACLNKAAAEGDSIFTKISGNAYWTFKANRKGSRRRGRFTLKLKKGVFQEAGNILDRYLPFWRRFNQQQGIQDARILFPTLAGHQYTGGGWGGLLKSAIKNISGFNITSCAIRRAYVTFNENNVSNELRDACYELATTQQRSPESFMTSRQRATGTTR
jgi:hypothetical protein